MLHAQAQLALLSIDGKNLGLDYLANAKDIARMINALFRADLTHVNHAFHSFGKLHKGAEVGDARDWPLDDGPRRESLRGIGPRISERLFES